MKIVKLSSEGVVGCIFIILSGILFTFERFLSVFAWIGEVAPVKINGSGEYPSNPTMPGLFDNLFVPLFLLAGILLLIINAINKKENNGS